MERRAPSATGRRHLPTPSAERLRPNPSKPNQIQTKPDQENGLGLSWIPSSDSGLFNGLRAVQNKNATRKMEFWSPPGCQRASSPLPEAMGASGQSPWVTHGTRRLGSSGRLRIRSRPPRIEDGRPRACGGRRRSGARLPGADSNLFKPLRRHFRVNRSPPPIEDGRPRPADRRARRAPFPGANRGFSIACAAISGRIASGLSTADNAPIARGPGRSVASVRDPSGEPTRAGSAAAENSPASRFPRPGWPRGDARRLTAREFCQ